MNIVGGGVVFGDEENTINIQANCFLLNPSFFFFILHVKSEVHRVSKNVVTSSKF